MSNDEKREFDAVISRGASIDEALAWLAGHYFDDIGTKHIPRLPWMKAALRLGIAAAQRDPETVADILEFCHSATDYDVFWQHFRNEGDIASERAVRQDFIAEMRQFLSRMTTRKEKIEELVQMVRDEERDPWMKRGSPEWLELHRERAKDKNLSLDAERHAGVSK